MCLDDKINTIQLFFFFFLNIVIVNRNTKSEAQNKKHQHQSQKKSLLERPHDALLDGIFHRRNHGRACIAQPHDARIINLQHAARGSQRHGPSNYCCALPQCKLGRLLVAVVVAEQSFEVLDGNGALVVGNGQRSRVCEAIHSCNVAEGEDVVVVMDLKEEIKQKRQSLEDEKR